MYSWSVSHEFIAKKGNWAIFIVGHRLSLLQADTMGVYSSDLYPPKWEIASNWVRKMLMLVRSPKLISVLVLFFFMLSYPTFLHLCWIIVLILIQVTIKVKVMWRLCLKNLMWGKLLFNVVFTAYGTCWGWGLISQILQYEFDPLSVDTAHYLLGESEQSVSQNRCPLSLWEYSEVIRGLSCMLLLFLQNASFTAFYAYFLKLWDVGIQKDCVQLV